MPGKIFLHVTKNMSKTRRWQTSWETVQAQEKLCIFASFKMTHNCYINMNISFYSKTENSIINCVPSLLKANCAERLSSKNKIKDT